MALPLELVTPDAIFNSDGVQENPLSPCPLCNSHPEDSPEGVHDVYSASKTHAEVGSPRWYHPHCWKCGYRPGTNKVVSEVALRQSFDQYKGWLAEQFEELKNARGLTAPSSDAEVAQLKHELAVARGEAPADEPNA